MPSEKWLDDVVSTALRQRRKVTLYLCSDGGFGIRIDGKIVAREMPWETFEIPMEEALPKSSKKENSSQS